MRHRRSKVPCMSECMNRSKERTDGEGSANTPVEFGDDARTYRGRLAGTAWPASEVRKEVSVVPLTAFKSMNMNAEFNEEMVERA